MGTKKKENKKLTPKEADDMLRAIATVLEDAGCGFMFAVKHPDEDTTTVAHGGTVPEFIMLSQMLEITAKRTCMDLLKAGDITTEERQEIVDEIEKCNKVFGPERSKLMKELSAEFSKATGSPEGTLEKLAALKEAVSKGTGNPLDLLKKILADAEKDPNAKIQILEIKRGDGEELTEDALNKLFGTAKGPVI